MDFGFGLPTGGPLANPDDLIALAQRGEQLGFAYASANDHIVIPTDVGSRYPYSESGEFGGAYEFLEQLTVLGFVAAATSRVRLLTSVMILPHRGPVHTAKILASIDVLSGGRLTVGCGVGWMREEFEALGAPPFDDRGTVGDEYISAFKELWTKERPEFDGKYCKFSDVMFEPKPVQKPHPPIWIGGESPQALRRAARLGDGWYPLSGNPTHPMRTLESLSAGVQRLHRYAESAGRDPSEIDLAYSAGWSDSAETEDGGRRAFTGAPQQVAEDLRAYGDVGVRHMMVGLRGRTLGEVLERMERFATEIAPLV